MIKKNSRVKLKANEDEGWPEEFGKVIEVEKKGMLIVKLDDKFILEDDDDGIREIHSDDVEEL